jgi:hypothetical protein
MAEFIYINNVVSTRAKVFQSYGDKSNCFY